MDAAELRATAELAELELDDAQAEALGQAVEHMLEYFTIMDEVAVQDLEPTTHALLRENRTRSDRVSSPDLADALLERAPDLEDRFVVIPNVL
jgi:aspartyl-tRNA(Asn)/glutamyl-tRNA(Gln) amidotransferase subunit C